MSDARALLRAQRTARRITHPHANYSSAGTLLCTLCREPIKTESLWDAHVSSSSHQKRVTEQKEKQEQQSKEAQPKQNGEQQKTMEVVTSHKRKHDDDEEMADAEQENGDVRRKRSRGDISVPDDEEKDVTKTPPTLPRRSSQTPSQGVELQIPSRPATPRDTPNISSSSSTASAKVIPGPPISQAKTEEKKSVDEDEWAAFEADIAAASTTYDDATISAPAMTAEESAKAKEEIEDGDPRRKQSKPEVDLAEEREEAQRALEEEFDEMKELQERVTQLKERRESLRQRAQSQSQTTDREKAREGLGKENGKASAVAVLDEEDESSEDDEDDDDWDSFRFRR